MERLKRVLRGNAVFSEVSGLTLLFGSAVLDDTLGLDTWFLMLVGGLLVAYAGLLWWLAGHRDVVAGARFATAMDIGWVMGAAVILVAFPEAMTATGRLALLVVSMVVLGFAEAQFLGTRGLGGGRSAVRSTA